MAKSIRFPFQKHIKWLLKSCRYESYNNSHISCYLSYQQLQHIAIEKWTKTYEVTGSAYLQKLGKNFSHFMHLFHNSNFKTLNTTTKHNHDSRARKYTTQGSWVWAIKSSRHLFANPRWNSLHKDFHQPSKSCGAFVHAIIISLYTARIR